MDEPVIFVKLGRSSRKVHVAVSRSSGMSWQHNLAFGYVSGTLCGRSCYQAFGGGQTGEFDDEALCATCYDAFPGEKSRLFEHEGAMVV